MARLVFPEGVPERPIGFTEPFKELLNRAQIIPQTEYQLRLEPLLAQNVFAWPAVTSFGSVKRDNSHELELNELLVNDDDGDIYYPRPPRLPRLPQLIAIEEAVRVQELRERIFGRNGIFADKDRPINMLTRGNISRNPQDYLKGGCIDPHYHFYGARLAGLRAAKTYAEALKRENGDNIAELYMRRNLKLAEGYVVLKGTLLEALGEGELRAMRALYRNVLAAR